MKRVTRRQARAWLAPMRRCFAQMQRSGEVDAVRGYAVTRLHDGDDYARVDFCIAGFRGLIERLSLTSDSAPLLRLERKLAAGVALTVTEIDDALRVLRHCENALLKHSVAELKGAVLTEQVAIEFEQMGVI